LTACSRTSIPRLATCHLRVALPLGEEQVPLAARSVQARARDQAQRDERAGDSGGDCDHDCHENEHGRSYGLVARTTHCPPLGVPGAAAALSSRRAVSISGQGLWLSVPWGSCLWDRGDRRGFKKRKRSAESALCRQK